MSTVFALNDATELMPVYVDPQGNCDVCFGADHLAVMWSVYGHLRAGGVECITDITTQRMALNIATTFDRAITAVRS